MHWCCVKMLVVACIMEHVISRGLAADPQKCVNNGCRNGATCEPRVGGYNWGYRCICPPGFFGSQCQWDDLTSCNVNTKTPCVNGGQCSITQDGRFCECPKAGANDRSFPFGGHYCELANPCDSCPAATVFCQSAQTLVTGRLCLNSQRMEIQPRYRH